MPNISPHTFVKGWDTDTDFGYLSNQSYIDASNLRLTSAEGNTKGALENIVGNSPWTYEYLGVDYELREALNSPLVLDTSDWHLIGHVNVREDLILFLSQNTTDPTAGGNNWIVRVRYDNDEITSISVLYSNTSLNFARSYPIKAVSRYERSDIQKIYWVDGYNSVRFANVADTSLSSYDVDKFDILADVTFGTVTFEDEISGTIPEGKVQYTYQLFNKYGQETPYSPVSKGYNINPGENSIGGGLRLSIDDLDTDFNSIRLVALYYSSINTIPTVRIVYEGQITGTTQYFSDTGFSLGELTYEEVSIFGNTDLVANEIAVKNNYLFVANIKEESFDVVYDTRAYRFESGAGADAKLYEADLSTNIDVDSSNWSTFDPVDSEDPNGTHDCINLFNDPDNSAGNQYLYQSDGTTLGAEGPNVLIEFAVNAIYIDTIGSTDMYVDGDDFGEVETASKWVGYKRSEVYRFGAVLINKKGQRSPVKWICDLKMPDITNGSDYEVAVYSSATNRTSANSIGVYISFKNVPTSVEAIEVVRVKRQPEDRSVIAQGSISYTQMINSSGTGILGGTTVPALKDHSYGGWMVFDVISSVSTFFSPEVSFGNAISYSSGDKFKLAGKLSQITRWEDGEIAYDTDLNRGGVVKYKSAGVAAENDDVATILAFEKIQQYTDTILDSDPEHTIGSSVFKYRHIAIGEADGDYATSGTSLVCELSSGGFSHEGTNLSTSNFYPETYLVDYVKNIFDGQYLGPSLSSRLSNEYISTGTVILKGENGYSATSSFNSLATAFGGDTFINMFDCLYGSYPSGSTASNDKKVFVNLYFPVESSINLALRKDKSFNDIYNQDGAYLLKEEPGLYKTDGGEEFEFEEKLYQYNTAFSQEGTGRQYFTTNEYDLEEEYGTRVYVSDKKFNGEISDSWTKFRVNNYLDVDAQYGEITNLAFHFNELLFWQTKAFGILPVEQRSLINDNSPGTLALGTGDVLGRYDYLSIDVGNQSRFGIIKADSGLYWYDNYNTAIYRYSGSLQPINKLKGLDSYLETSIDYDVTMTGVYDYKHNDIIFSFIKNQFTSGEYVQNCILFNELFDVFVSWLNTDPVYFIQLFDKRYIGVDGSLYKFYEYNKGNYCNFEGIAYESTITLVDNVSYSQQKVYDNIEYYSKSTNSIGANIFSNTFSKLKVYNDYQNTAGWNLFVGATKDNLSRILPVERRERNFTIAIPRNAMVTGQEGNPNINSGTLNTTQEFAERIRGNYAVMKFEYNNANNYKFSVPFINVIYRISAR